VAAHAIPPKLYAIKDNRHAHAARRPNIRGFHHQNLKAVTRIFFFMVYDQNYYNCFTLGGSI
jgi:hypothetical protein